MSVFPVADSMGNIQQLVKPTALSEQCLCCHLSLVKVLEVKLSSCSWDVQAQMAFGETGAETFTSAVCYIIALYFVELQIEPDSWYALIMPITIMTPMLTLCCWVL